MKLARSTIEKYKEDLFLCMEKLQGASPDSANDKEYLDFLIMWLKVRQICLNAQNLLQNDSSTVDDSQTYSSLLEKFNQQIQPKLPEYMRNLKNRPLSDRILTFNHRMQEYSALVQEIIKEQPHEAMKVYEQTQFFLLIYQFTLDQVFIRDIRSNLHKKMLDLTNIIEKIEAGDTELIQKQLEDLDQKISNVQSPIIYRDMGVVYEDREEYDRAIECYQKILEIDPFRKSAWLYIGLAYVEKLEFDRALESYNKALAIDPQYRDAWENIGIVYTLKMEYDQAIKAYNRAMAIDNTQIRVRKRYW